LGENSSAGTKEQKTKESHRRKKNNGRGIMEPFPRGLRGICNNHAPALAGHHLNNIYGKQVI